MPKAAAKILTPDNVYKQVEEGLFNVFTEANFADVYPDEGKPGNPPVILGFVSVLQYLEKYPDR